MDTLAARVKRTLLGLVTLTTAGVGFLRDILGRAGQRPAVATAAELARRTWRELGDDFATDQAAAVSYYAVLSLFPPWPSGWSACSA